MILKLLLKIILIYQQIIDEIKKNLSSIDEFLKQSTEYGQGIKEYLSKIYGETIISFIISANNNIPRVKGIIERISKKYGKKDSISGKRILYFSQYGRTRTELVYKRFKGA